MEAEKRLNDVIAVTRRLIDVLGRENEMLTERRFSDLHGIIDEKETIARVYQARVMGLSENPEWLESASEETRATLEALGKEVTDLMVMNERMLSVSMTVCKRVLDLVADAVAEAAPKSGTYSQKGNTTAAPRTGGSMSFSLNETL